MWFCWKKPVNFGTYSDIYRPVSVGWPWSSFKITVYMRNEKLWCPLYRKLNCWFGWHSICCHNLLVCWSSYNFCLHKYYSRERTMLMWFYKIDDWHHHVSGHLWTNLFQTWYDSKQGWIGHTPRKPASSITCQALTWNPQGKRKRGQPHNSWRQDTEEELKQHGTNWSEMARAAQNRVQWRGVVDGLCSTRSDGHK